MSAHAAELSSLATALEELTRRVAGLAEAYNVEKREDLATELFAVERLLVNATRRLDRVVSNETGAPGGGRRR